MTEWTVVTVVAALAGLLLAIVKPIVNLNTSITRLTEAVGTLQDNLKCLTTNNTDSHNRLWAHSKTQDEKLENHERRIQRVEDKER